MSTSSPDSQPPPKRRCGAKRFACCCSPPVLFALCLFLIYTYNNHLPDIPTRSAPADNGWNYLDQAFLLSKVMEHKCPTEIDGPPAEKFTLANYKGCAKDAVPILNLLRQALDHPFVLVTGPFVYMEYGKAREVARVNSDASDYFAVSGNPGLAMQMRLNGLEMAVKIPHTGWIAYDWRGQLCENIAVVRMEPLLPQLSPTELSSAAKRIDQISVQRTPFADILREEASVDAAVTQDAFKALGLSKRGLSEARYLAGVTEDKPVQAAERFRYARKIFTVLVENKRAVLEQNANWYEALAREANGPYISKSRIAVPDNVFVRDAADDIHVAWAHHVTMEAEVTVLQAEIAIYRYNSANHRFPAALSELCPKFLRVVPLDPFGGGPNKPLRYALKPDGSFLLYSLGPDLKDDGGVPAINVGDFTADFNGDFRGDIVAGKLYKNGPILYSGTANKR